MKYKKILILGSGALQIGQAGEFDYSGSQAIKALKEEGIKTVLINPNIATVQTSKSMADKVYFLPVTPYFVEKIMQKEKPDGILLSFGGQTALNCGIALHKDGIFEKYNVKVLGTPLSAIMLTEDRDAFAKHLHTLNIPTPKSHAVTSVEEAKKIAKQMKFPLMMRSGFSLGGQGSGIVKSMPELIRVAKQAFAFVPQILIEEYLHHYKEVEYEVVRDSYDNCITVCNMENMDPLGIHTGESIVVAPSQTLTNTQYHSLRENAIKIVKSLGIVGECNVQFALDPFSDQFYVIEVNARLSRSSALASKATGYPLAYIAAKLALLYSLPELQNNVTKKTSACFEPSLDYVVVKIPRWDMEKFKGAEIRIGTSMKSVGEVMGIGRTFEEAYQKAIRMLDLSYQGVTDESLVSKKDIREQLKTPIPNRFFLLAHAIRQHIPLTTIHRLTGIDMWFLYRVEHLVKLETKIKRTKSLTKELMWHLKQVGFSDRRIGDLVDKTGLEIRDLRKSWGIVPSIFQIDTLAAEFPAETNYLYMTYNGHHHDVQPLGQTGVMLLGSGPYRIGSSVEFDWTNVLTTKALKKYKKKSIVVNCNPETVSTDYDISDRLYFEELTFERIADIYDFENPEGIIVSVGGQTPNNRVDALNTYGARILGTQAKDIDRAEDRSKFSALCDSLGIAQPAWDTVTTFSAAETFAKKVGYPVLIRPSYVLSGSAMNVCSNDEELRQFIDEATIVSKEFPITISKFYDHAKEVEFDAVAQRGEVKVFVISEHIENAGVHSGDATVVLPAQEINTKTKEKIEKIGRKLIKALNITGPCNIQFLAKDNDAMVIEANVRSSRTFPFVSKVTGVDFMHVFVDCLYSNDVTPVKVKEPTFVAVKVPQFSFSRLKGADPKPHVEMASTGEVACFGETMEEAYLKGFLAVGGTFPKKGIVISLTGEEKKERFLESIKMLLPLGLPIYATKGTHAFLEKAGIPSTRVYKLHEDKGPTILELLQKGGADLVINVVDRNLKQDIKDAYHIRRGAIDANVPLFTKIKNARLFIQAISNYSLDKLTIKSWDEYLK